LSSAEDFANRVLSSRCRTCPECKKLFIVSCVDLWTYKIGNGTRTVCYCGYSCWTKAGNRKARTKLTNQEAYWERLRQKKKKENQKRRQKNGSAQNV
jgi:hypothetical protein